LIGIGVLFAQPVSHSMRVKAVDSLKRFSLLIVKTIFQIISRAGRKHL
jgi:hypothetical protein